MNYRQSSRSKRRHHHRPSSFLPSLLVLVSIDSVQSFSVMLPHHQHTTHSRNAARCYIYAPPGSGYARPEDEKSSLPDTYEPMMQFPGTMRPGKTPENMPYQDLPLADGKGDPYDSPVPWPHFQQIEWHHRWEPPHEHPVPMEEFIAMHGRWATPEQEAAVRVGARRGAMRRQEQVERERRDTVITDDEEDYVSEEPVALGDGVFGRLGSDADRALTAEAVSPQTAAAEEEKAEERAEEEEEEEEKEGVRAFEEDDGLDDFLLDLGLDTDMDDGEGSDEEEEDKDDEDTAGGPSQGVTATINVDEDEDLGMLSLEDEDELGDDVDTVPLEDFGDDDSDQLDTEDIFDEGGFDFDDGDFGGDMDDVW